MKLKIRIFLLSMLFFVTGCTTTTSVKLEAKPVGQPVRNGIDFDVSAQEGASSTLTKHFPNGFCGLNLEARVKNVNMESEWNPYSKISFASSDENKYFDILFYYDISTLKITPLIKYSSNDAAESLGISFNINEAMTVMIYRDQDELGFAIEAASKLNNLLRLNPAEKRSGTFEFFVVELGYIPSKVTFSGVSSESLFKRITFKEGC